MAEGRTAEDGINAFKAASHNRSVRDDRGMRVMSPSSNVNDLMRMPAGAAEKQRNLATFDLLQGQGIGGGLRGYHQAWADVWEGVGA